MIAEVAFDAPVRHSFSYRVPDGWTVTPGQRARAPLRGAARVGMVVAVREGNDAGLKPLARLVDAAPVLSKTQLDLVDWIAAQSLSSVGSTCAALLPPPVGADGGGSLERIRDAADRPASPKPELLIGAGREKRVLERLETTVGTALVITADVETAARWAHRLAKLDHVVRLDSGVPDEERAAAWGALRDGSARLAAGTRSALLAPLPPSATLVLIDEHEAAHKPPGAPRMHSRDVALERAAREPLALLLTAATPSAEAWWRAESGLVDMPAREPGPWPAVSIADTRGILRREPLTPPLSRAIRETLAAKRRVFLVVSRLTSSLACDECGAVVRCAECAIAFAYSRAAARLVCRVCGGVAPAARYLRGVSGVGGSRRSAGAPSASSTPCAAASPTRASRAGIPSRRAAPRARRSARPRPRPTS